MCQILSQEPSNVYFLLYRSFSTRIIKHLLKGYVCYVLPLVSYCSQVWAPYLLADIYALEGVQRLFTRRLPGMEKMSYCDRLKTLKLPSLELRRLWADLLFCFKIIHGHVAGPMERYGLKFVTHKREGRGHNLKLCSELGRIDARLHYFGARVVKPWNALPVETVNATSVNVFKSNIKDCNFNTFLNLTT